MYYIINYFKNICFFLAKIRLFKYCVFLTVCYNNKTVDEKQKTKRNINRK